MYVAFVSNWGYGTGIALRLQAEGHTVLMYCDPGKQRDGTLNRTKLTGEGLVPKTESWAYLLSWAKEYSRRNPTVMIFENTSMSKQADEARKAGLHVIGNGGFCYRLEDDRLFGFKIAADAGAALPPYEDFTSLTDAIAFCKTIGSTGTYWKTDKYLDADSTYGADDGEEMTAYLEGVRRAHGDVMKCIIQKKMDGVPISTSRWWNGRAWVGQFEGDIEHKKALNGELGPSTGCSFDAVWFYDDDLPPIAKALGWEQLAETFIKYEAPPGIYDMNAIVNEDGDAYFLEWTPRFGWDSTPTSFPLVKGELGAFFWGLVSGTANGPDVSNKLSYSIRMGVPPYPWEHWSPTQGDHQKFKPVPIYGLELDDPMFMAYQIAYNEEVGLYCANADGLLGIAHAQGTRVSALHEQVVEWIKDHRHGIPGLFARTDGDKMIADDVKVINAGPLKVPEGLGK